MEPNHMTFDTFIPGVCNAAALEAALAAARDPGGAPLYIFGPTGVGKTHLLQAIADHLRRIRPSLKVVFVHADRFLADLIQAICRSTLDEFDEKYRRADVLLLDDLQFLMDKETSFVTFVDICRQAGQVVVTADRPPVEELFTHGRVVKLDPPDAETRTRILRAKAARLELALDPAVEELLVRTFPDNVRILEGALTRLLAYRDLLDLPITPENAARLLSDSET